MGKDVSHWFDPRTKEPKKRMCSKTGIRDFFCRDGTFLHMKTFLPFSVDANSKPEKGEQEQVPWWKDSQYIIGRLSPKEVRLQVINMLTKEKNELQIAPQETFNEILNRYKEVNEYASAYIWKNLDNQVLFMKKSFKDNRFNDQTELFTTLRIPESEWFMPTVLVYFADDSTNR